MEVNPNGIQNFYAHGKLLISGEYLVLRGAKALAIPLRYGQSLQITTTAGKPQLFWKAFYPGKKWFEATFDLLDFRILVTDNPELAGRLRKILLEARMMNPDFLKTSSNIMATSQLNFPPDWGIGSSSSLIANIGQWAGIDPFELNRRIFGGSGYDIAAALSNEPVIYQLVDGLPVYNTIGFDPPFKDRIWFVYQNIKENSQIAVRKFTEMEVSSDAINAISEITHKISITQHFDEFLYLIEEHEKIISKVLSQTTVKKRLFHDFDGSIKSLGAWGGDFVLAASAQPPAYIRNYFIDKGLSTHFRYDEMKV